jgi:signal transduction histidine kinase
MSGADSFPALPPPPGLRVPWRTVAFRALLFAGTGAVQLALLDRALPGSVAGRAVVAAVLVPLFFSTALTALVTTVVAKVRIEELLRVLREVATGNFGAKLREPGEPVVRVVRDAFAATGAALERLRARLAFADAQRRRLFSDLAHELATPSSAILGLVDTLSAPGLVPTEEGRAALLLVLDGEASRLARLVADMRDLAMVEDPDIAFAREPLDLGRLVEDATDRFRVVHPQGAALHVRAEPVWASVDDARLEQVLVNLLRNAKRYAPAGGRIEVALAPDGRWARLVVEDSGPPLPDATLARLGDRLFRGDPSRSAETGGAGLGLAIVRSVVARHGGTVDFGRGESGGLRVVVRVPACEAPVRDGEVG